MNFDVAELLIRAPIVLLALTAHEFSHGYFAYRMGDPTARLAGRLSLNPIKHLDPLGTLCLLFAPIGWAKPVPINPLNFDDRRRGILVSTAAGPGANLVLACLFALAIRGLLALAGADRFLAGQAGHPLNAAFLMCYVAVIVNVGLAVFNCLPLYPLDGFHILSQLVSPRSREKLADTAHYGPFVILGIIVLERASNVDILSRLIRPVVEVLLVRLAGMGPA